MQHKIYNQMLQNHTRPPGPQNRGQRSELIHDKRPLADQIMDNIKDNEKPTQSGKEYRDFNDFMSNQQPDIDEVFAQREMKDTFKQ